MFLFLNTIAAALKMWVIMLECENTPKRESDTEMWHKAAAIIFINNESVSRSLKLYNSLFCLWNVRKVVYLNAHIKFSMPMMTSSNWLCFVTNGPKPKSIQFTIKHNRTKNSILWGWNQQMMGFCLAKGFKQLIDFQNWWFISCCFYHFWYATHCIWTQQWWCFLERFFNKGWKGKDNLFVITSH